MSFMLVSSIHVQISMYATMYKKIDVVTYSCYEYSYELKCGRMTRWFTWCWFEHAVIVWLERPFSDRNSNNETINLNKLNEYLTKRIKVTRDCNWNLLAGGVTWFIQSLSSKKTGKGDVFKCLLNVKCDIRLYLIKCFAEESTYFF